MIAVDTSVIIAILQDEPDAPQLVSCLGEAPGRCVSAGSILEAGIVIGSKHGEPGLAAMRELCLKLALETVPVDAGQSRVGYEAFRRYGRGTGHPAALNFGDCFAYALAKTRKLPLLFKGDDFVHTDVEPVPRPGKAVSA